MGTPCGIVTRLSYLPPTANLLTSLFILQFCGSLLMKCMQIAGWHFRTLSIVILHLYVKLTKISIMNGSILRYFFGSWASCSF